MPPKKLRPPGEMILVREKDTRFPSYIAYTGDARAVCRVDQAAGRKNGWCVYLYDRTPGEDDSSTQWFGRFEGAKGYAAELVKARVSEKQKVTR